MIVKFSRQTTQIVQIISRICVTILPPLCVRLMLITDHLPVFVRRVWQYWCCSLLVSLCESLSYFSRCVMLIVPRCLSKLARNFSCSTRVHRPVSFGRYENTAIVSHLRHLRTFHPSSHESGCMTHSVLLFLILVRYLSSHCSSTLHYSNLPVSRYHRLN